jgi:putative heme-binding domain-containing protein
MRPIIRTLAVTAALTAASQALAQISITEKEVIMVNGNATPALNGPLGSFVGNVGTNTGVQPRQSDGNSGMLPVDRFPTTPLLTPALLPQAQNAITVPDEFVASVYGLPPIVSYATGVAAAPDGTVFIALDGNGASNAWDHMGRVVRLKDNNHDGVADQATAFVPDVDSPRGVLWYHDHLLVLAAPNLTAYYDRNGDGVADESKVLIKNFGRTIADARVDHGQNTLEVGIDGWIYIALGDQGVRDATGTDGRKLTLRGGGVVRVRPDGSGMEVWAHNSRNVYGLAVGPTLEVFGRDNTNDGGGWNVRFHHFSGMTDHGYPTLFTNFANEVVTPLADFGGGSGVGGMWLDEPGIPAKWNDLPMTGDYGQRAVFAHHVQPKGATYTLPGYAVSPNSVNGVPLLIPGQEGSPAGNEPFIEAPTIMDVDVDANSVIYVVKWAQGIPVAGWDSASAIFRIAPKNFTAAPLPNFDTISANELVAILAGNSHVRRIEAQRAILRRAAQLGNGIDQQLLALARDTSKSLNNRTAALFTYKQLRGAASTQAIAAMVSDPTIAALALRALGDDLTQARSIPINVVTGALKSTDPRTRKEALITLARAGSVASAPLIAPLMGDEDPIISHTAIQVLRSLRAVDQALAVIDNAGSPAAVREGALQVLKTIHTAKVTDALIQRLRDDQPVAKRQDIVAALSRLSNTETAWNGTWWATRPQNVGPYFAPTSWSETAKIQAALSSVLDRAGPEEVLAMGKTFQKEGVSAGPAVAKFLAYADSEPALIPQITSYFAAADTIPANAVPVLTKVASAPGTAATVRAEAISALAKTNDRATWATVLPSVRMLNTPAAAAGGRGGAPTGGRGGAAGPAAPAIPNASQLQTLLVTGMETATVQLLQAVTTARTALTTASLNADAATITARANAVADAELALATARATEFAKIQASAAKFNAQQVAALAAQQAVAGPAAAAAGRGGGGGRGGAAGPTPVQVAQQAVINTPAIDEVYSLLIDEAAKLDGENSQLADAALVNLAARRFGAPAPRDAAVKALEAGWANPARRAQIIMATVTARDTSLASKIVAAQNDSDVAVARAATYAVQQLNIDVAGLAARATQPKVGEMSVEQALAAVVPAKGSIVRGQQLTRELGCVSCHGFGPGGEPKGPDLSKVSGILARRELAEAILVPSKTISQGFPATTLDLKNGTSILGFVVGDGGGTVTIRTVEAKNIKVASADIAKRTAMEVSLMPPVAGDLTVTEFASLLDYIESLSKP